MSDLVDRLQALQTEARALRKDIRAEKVTQIAKKVLRNRAEDIAKRWLSSFSQDLLATGLVPSSLVEQYDADFKRLLKLSAPNNQKSSYDTTLTSILKKFRDDLILPVQGAPEEIAKPSPLHEILEGLPDAAENEYLQEAIACARHGLLRASAVLGWCAAIDRIHRKIEDVGFAKFNVASMTMASATKGRFKRFNSPQNVGSISELREVFDTVVLWVLEGMQLIDSNQQTRLRSCFDLRCHCAHPGDAPLTQYNLMSFFSDIDQIVLRGPRF